MQVTAASPKGMYVLLLMTGLACCSRTPERWGHPEGVPPASWRTVGAPSAASMCRDVHGCLDIAQDLGLQLPGRSRALLQVGAGALTAGAGDPSVLNAGQGSEMNTAPPLPTTGLPVGPRLPPPLIPAASMAGDQSPSSILRPPEANGNITPPIAGAQIGADSVGAQNQISASSTGPGASFMMGPQAGAAANAQSTLGAVGAGLPGTGVSVPGQVPTAPPPLNEGVQAGFNGSQNQLSVGAAGPSTGPRTVVSQDSTPSDDDVDDDASPASAPESILGGIYEGVPAGGPSEPLVDDGAEGAGPSAAPPVTAQDIMSSYAALILGTGD